MPRLWHFSNKFVEVFQKTQEQPAITEPLRKRVRMSKRELSSTILYMHMYVRKKYIYSNYKHVLTYILGYSKCIYTEIILKNLKNMNGIAEVK